MYKKLEISGLKKEYLIDEHGNVFDITTNKFRKPYFNNKGYVMMSFYIDGKSKTKFVHRLVLGAFAPIIGMENLQVNHKDGDKRNNHIDNLEWCTQSENQKHAYKMGLNTNKGIKNPACKLTEKEVIEIADLLLQNVTVKKLSEMYNVSESAIGFIRAKRHWQFLLKDYNFPKSKYSHVK